jgi:hypothetical protein
MILGIGSWPPRSLGTPSSRKDGGPRLNI